MTTKETYTNQTAFDTAARHLLKQNSVSRTLGGSVCAYRGYGGAKCAVGALIDDDVYSESMESWSVQHLVESRQLSSLDSVSIRLLQALQYVHDCRDPSRWRESLADVAAEFSLSAAVLDEVQS